MYKTMNSLRKVKCFILLIIIIVLSFQISYSIIDRNIYSNDSLKNENFSNLKKSGYWILNPFIIDDQGYGNYTWEEAVIEPWCSGGGTWSPPYLL
ncbi:MAG: hypothetical protein CEE43_00345 [Promethearchaeota archaeon Loki_b32]|nr:MAG: hypothetical protein CEE43_00345 [Candidatus Lokiarchaeota archaeon Loki_b32]